MILSNDHVGNFAAGPLAQFTILLVAPCHYRRLMWMVHFVSVSWAHFVLRGKKGKESAAAATDISAAQEDKHVKKERDGIAIHGHGEGVQLQSYQ